MDDDMVELTDREQAALDRYLATYSDVDLDVPELDPDDVSDAQTPAERWLEEMRAHVAGEAALELPDESPVRAWLSSVALRTGP